VTVSRFQRVDAPGAVLWTAPEFTTAVMALEPLRPGGLERLLVDGAPATDPGDSVGSPGTGPPPDSRADSQDGSQGRAATKILALADRPERLHVRPLRHGGWLAPLWGQNVAGLGRALAECEVTASLREAGAPVPRPAFVLGHRRGWLWRAAIATVHEEETLNGAAFLASAPADSTRLRAARAAARAIRRFHDVGGQHADLHIANLILRNDGQHSEVVIVDLDRARHTSPPSPARRMRELMRLQRSLEKRSLQSSPSDGAECVEGAFLDEYVAGDCALRDALLRHLPRERRRIARHAFLWRAAPR